MTVPRGRAAVRQVEEAGVLGALAAYDPVIVGTFPLELDRPGSDVDILCHADDLEGFERDVTERLGSRSDFRSHRRVAPDQAEASVVRFELTGLPVEIFAQPVPTRDQRGHRHFVVEARLLELGGERLAARLRAARRPGESVEVAFAQVLRLPGDPYLAVLALHEASDATLQGLVDAALQAGG